MFRYSLFRFTQNDEATFTYPLRILDEPLELPIKDLVAVL